MRASIAIAWLYLLGVSAFGTVSIEWVTFGRILDPANGNQPVADGSIAQLIWSPDKIVGVFEPWNPLVPTGNDVLIEQTSTVFGGFIAHGVVSLDGSDLGTVLPPPYNVEDGELDGQLFGDYSWGPPTTGDDAMVYTRIFNSAAPGPGDYWSEAVLWTLSDQDPPFGAGPGPQLLDWTGGSDRSLQIPEPATWVLMGMGLATAIVCRRRRSGFP